jgi:hypothetical protein
MYKKQRLELDYNHNQSIKFILNKGDHQTPPAMHASGGTCSRAVQVWPAMLWCQVHVDEAGEAPFPHCRMHHPTRSPSRQLQVTYVRYGKSGRPIDRWITSSLARLTNMAPGPGNGNHDATMTQPPCTSTHRCLAIHARAYK